MSRISILKEIVDTHVTDKRTAARWARAEADSIIEQLERFDRGWDKGLFRDDEVLFDCTIDARIAGSVDTAFHLSRKWGQL